MTRPKPTAAEAKPGKRERTRRALIAAAAAVIGEKGFDRTSLEEVAARAGMSRGAIYGNFADKEELFLAVIEQHWQPVIPQFEPGGSLKRQMHLMGKAVAAAAKERLPQAGAACAFQLYAVTHSEMRKRMTKENAAIYKAAAKSIAKLVPASQLPMPAEQFAKVLDAVTTGLMFTYFQTPALLPESVFIAAFEALA
ncbi:MAG TPA: TetR/AcrR family transcriptional regulator [Gammaproteobacteria bacterium]|nr:TetR/AcrR family transcriptional regulator [Gammaproteobacteria bacterium]